MKKTLRPTGGHILDIDSLEVADNFLSLANNVHTRKGFPSRIGGRRVAYPVISGVLDAFRLHNFNLNTFNWWLAFGADEIHAYETANEYDVSLPAQSTVANPHEWSSTLLNGIPVFTNGKDGLMYWTGDASDNADIVDDWPATTVCRAVVAFRYHLFALNIENASGNFENLVLWSDAAEPGTLPASWTPALSNEAGSSILADTPGRCVMGLPLATQLMIYKPQSIYAFEYQGQQPDNIFTNRPVVRSIGALGPNCVIEVGFKGGTQHLVMGNDDIVLTDGVNVQSIADGRIKTFLTNSIDENNVLNSFIVRDLSKREVWVCVPEAGSQFATVAHIWDERRDTWVTRDLNQARYGTTGYVLDTAVDDTWDADAAAWDTDLAPWSASSTGAIARVVLSEGLTQYVEDTADAVSLTAQVAKHDITFDDETQVKVTSRVWLIGTGAGFASLRFRLGARDAINDSIVWGALVDVNTEDGTPYEVAGRFISIEVQSTGADAWTLDRIELEAQFDGTF